LGSVTNLALCFLRGVHFSADECRRRKPARQAKSAMCTLAHNVAAYCIPDSR
jgi:hypothetical protein